MSLKEQITKAVEELSIVHEANRVAYRKALQKKTDANEELRRLNDIAHISANELGVARKALDELNRAENAVSAIEAEGDVKASQAGE